jgi:uncharacterized protein (DUF2345 family)
MSDKKIFPVPPLFEQVELHTDRNFTLPIAGTSTVGGVRTYTQPEANRDPVVPIVYEDYNTATGDEMTRNEGRVKARGMIWEAGLVFATTTLQEPVTDNSILVVSSGKVALSSVGSFTLTSDGGFTSTVKGKTTYTGTGDISFESTGGLLSFKSNKDTKLESVERFYITSTDLATFTLKNGLKLDVTAGDFTNTVAGKFTNTITGDILLKSATGTVEINSETKTLTLNSGDKTTITAAKNLGLKSTTGDVSIDSDAGDLTLTSKKNTSITATTSLDIKAKGDSLNIISEANNKTDTGLVIKTTGSDSNVVIKADGTNSLVKIEDLIFDSTTLYSESNIIIKAKGASLAKALDIQATGTNSNINIGTSSGYVGIESLIIEDNTLKTSATTNTLRLEVDTDSYLSITDKLSTIENTEIKISSKDKTTVESTLGSLFINSYGVSNITSSTGNVEINAPAATTGNIKLNAAKSINIKTDSDSYIDQTSSVTTIKNSTINLISDEGPLFWPIYLGFRSAFETQSALNIQPRLRSLITTFKNSDSQVYPDNIYYFKINTLLDSNSKIINNTTIDYLLKSDGAANSNGQFFDVGPPPSLIFDTAKKVGNSVSLATKQVTVLATLNPTATDDSTRYSYLNYDLQYTVNVREFDYINTLGGTQYKQKSIRTSLKLREQLTYENLNTTTLIYIDTPGKYCLQVDGAFKIFNLTNYKKQEIIKDFIIISPEKTSPNYDITYNTYKLSVNTRDSATDLSPYLYEKNLSKDLLNPIINTIKPDAYNYLSQTTPNPTYDLLELRVSFIANKEIYTSGSNSYVDQKHLSGYSYSLQASEINSGFKDGSANYTIPDQGTYRGIYNTTDVNISKCFVQYNERFVEYESPAPTDPPNLPLSYNNSFFFQPATFIKTKFTQNLIRSFYYGSNYINTYIYPNINFIFEVTESGYISINPFLYELINGNRSVIVGAFDIAPLPDYQISITRVG